MLDRWLNSEGMPVTQEEMLKALNSSSGKLHVGTDSHLFGNEWLFATVACVYTEGKGGRFFYKRNKFARNTLQNLYDRLMKEATLSIFAAEEIKTLMNKDVTIHADVSDESKTNSSSKYKVALVKYVRAMGFSVITKPDSWASSSIADRKAR